jgi:hypothetical protein
MGQGEKRLEAMRRNPRDGWRIEDIEVVCSRYGIELKAPKSGSHYKVTHSASREILTIPAARPIKPIYIRQFVIFVDALRTSNDDD